MAGKICSRCKDKKKAEEFHKNKNRKDGLHGICKSCYSAYRSDYRSKNLRRVRDAERGKQKRFRANHADEIKQQQDQAKRDKYMCLLMYMAFMPADAMRVHDEWRSESIERARARGRKYYYRDHEKHKAKARRRDKVYPHLANARSAKRRALRLKATPQWSELEDIKLLYKEASEKGMHVDHIIPLKGEKVTGLHVLSNLQLLTPRENIQKSNKYAVG